MLQKPNEGKIYASEIKTVTKGYKGFDKDLKCRNFSFKVGETYIEKRDIRLCHVGFHFCKKLKDVFDFYSFADEKQNRFCEIEAYDQIIDDNDNYKSVTKEIKIIRELDKKEIIEIVNEPYWKKAKELQDNTPNLLIGGSMALALLEIMPEKMFNDIDVIVPTYITSVNGITFNYKKSKSGDNVDMSLETNDGFKIDFFINNKSAWVEKERKGVKYKVSNPLDIILAKVKYALPNPFDTDEIHKSTIYKSTKKHRQDLVQIFQTLNDTQNLTKLIDMF